MAVNGIEIKVGQKWRLANGTQVVVEEVDGKLRHKGHLYPVSARTSFGNVICYTHGGVEVIGDETSNDFVELIEDVPAAPAAPAPKPASAPELLQRAAQHMADRAATYDQPEGERSMGKTVAAFNAVTGRNLTEAEGWLLLDILKQVRLFQHPGYHADSAEDHIAYAALMAEAKSKEAV